MEEEGFHGEDVKGELGVWLCAVTSGGGGGDDGLVGGKDGIWRALYAVGAQSGWRGGLGKVVDIGHNRAPWSRLRQQPEEPRKGVEATFALQRIFRSENGTGTYQYFLAKESRSTTNCLESQCERDA